MNYTDFVIRLFTALALGGVIGLERQWRQRTTGLRTNSLVAMGSAMFVMMGALISGADSQSRVASYVVSGIGFLGGGVILRDGLNVRGLNTAATLWCTAAVGTLAGCGFLTLSMAGTLGVLVTNLVLRPLAYRINRFPRNPNLRSKKFSTGFGVRAVLWKKHISVPSSCKTSDALHWH